MPFPWGMFGWPNIKKIASVFGYWMTNLCLLIAVLNVMESRAFLCAGLVSFFIQGTLEEEDDCVFLCWFVQQLSIQRKLCSCGLIHGHLSGQCMCLLNFKFIGMQLQNDVEHKYSSLWMDGFKKIFKSYLFNIYVFNTWHILFFMLILLFATFHSIVHV